jgi:hypothetical protein
MGIKPQTKIKMIPLVEEPKDLFQGFHAYEFCYFKCGKRTKYWHTRTNQPVCKECAKVHKVAELPKSHPKYKVRTKKEYLSKSK